MVNYRCPNVRYAHGKSLLHTYIFTQQRSDARLSQTSIWPAGSPWLFHVKRSFSTLQTVKGPQSIRQHEPRFGELNPNDQAPSIVGTSGKNYDIGASITSTCQASIPAIDSVPSGPSELYINGGRGYEIPFTGPGQLSSTAHTIAIDRSRYSLPGCIRALRRSWNRLRHLNPLLRKAPPKFQTVSWTFHIKHELPRAARSTPAQWQRTITLRVTTCGFQSSAR